SWSFMPGILAGVGEDGKERRSDGLAVLQSLALTRPEHGPPLHLVETAPHAVRIPRGERELEARFPDRAPDAEGLGDGLARLLLAALLEVGGGEEVGGVLSPADRPLPPRLEDGVHLPRHSRMRPTEIPPSQSSSEFHRRRGCRREAQSLAGSDSASGSTLRTSPSTPRTRTFVPLAIGSPTLRPRHRAPFTKTGPSGAILPRASPTRPMR